MASLVVGGVFLLAMIAASAWAAAALPAGARIAIHCGFPERCYLAPKRAGLVIWPAAGAVVFGVFGGIAASSLAADWVAGMRDVLVPAILGVLLAFQAGALVLARRGFAGVAGEPGVAEASEVAEVPEVVGVAGEPGVAAASAASGEPDGETRAGDATRSD